jgi:hypothetical protein
MPQKGYNLTSKYFKRIKTSSNIEISTVLIVINILIYCTILILYFIKGETRQINDLTIFLAGCLAFENIGILTYEKRRRNPFLFILVLIMTVFYLSRVGTILFAPASVLGIHFQVSSELNTSLLFIILSNASMFFGFIVGGKYKSTQIEIKYWKYSDTTIRRAVIIICLVF